MPATERDDPTLDFMDKFEDPDEWDEIRDNVPIFKPHDAFDAEGNLKYRVDEKRLKEICDAINRNFAQHGKPIKLFIGHTRDPKTTPQTDQPPLLGYGINARLARFGPSKEPGIVTKWFIRKGKGTELEEYPERSPEFFPGSNEITAVAVLKTDPRLNMGMVYSRSDGAELYARGFDMPAPATEEIRKEDITKRPDEEPEVELDEDDELPEHPASTTDELSPEEAEKMMSYMAKCYGKHPHMQKILTHHAKKYGLSMPSGTDTAPPPVPAKPPIAPPPKPGREDMQRDAIAMKYQAMEKENSKLKRERKAERENYNRAMSEILVNRLTVLEGFKISDVSREVDYMASLDDAGRQGRANEIRANYARDDSPEAERDLDLRVMFAHGNVPTVPVYPGVSDDQEQEQYQMTEQDVDDVVRYCAEHKINTGDEVAYEKARVTVLAEKNKKNKRR